MFAKLYGGNHELWLSDPSAFWAGFDKIVDAAQERKLYMILSFELGSFGELAGEPLNALVEDSRSSSRALARRYAREVTARYHDRSTVLFWELTNELNLPTSIHPRERCDPHEPCFDTESLASFESDMVSVIRHVDTSRPISSGFSSPRPSAWHL